MADDGRAGVGHLRRDGPELAQEGRLSHALRHPAQLLQLLPETAGEHILDVSESRLLLLGGFARLPLYFPGELQRLQAHVYCATRVHLHVRAHVRDGLQVVDEEHGGSC